MPFAAHGESGKGQKASREKRASGRLGSSRGQHGRTVHRGRIEIAESELDIHLQQAHWTLSEGEQLASRLEGLRPYIVTREVLEKRWPGRHAIQIRLTHDRNIDSRTSDRGPD